MQTTLSHSIRLTISVLMLVVLSACGGGGGSDNDSPVPAPVQAPVLAAIGPQSVAETETLNFTVTATDADSTLELSATGLPSGATFNPSNGTFNWATVAGDAANSPYSVTFTATDAVDSSLTDSETVEITVTAVPVNADCTVGITSPVANSLTPAGTVGVQDASATLDVEATLSCTPEIPAGWGVKLAVAGANNGSIAEETVTSEPFLNTFTGLFKDEYTVTATVVDGSGADVSGTNTVAQVTPVGLGDYYIAIGDSITVGFGDDIDTDDVSADGRNVGGSDSGDPDTGGGFTPILNDLLTAELGYPHTVIMVATQGTTSDMGVTDVATALADHPNAQRVLIMYGMNDAGPPFASSTPSGLGLSEGDAGYDDSFKDNIEEIIDAVIADGKQPLLTKINVAAGDSANSGPYTDAQIDMGQGQRNVNILEYNLVIDELRLENGITIAAPDLYGFFTTLDRYNRQYFDNIHPNGVGYENIAILWRDILAP